MVPTAVGQSAQVRWRLHVESHGNDEKKVLEATAAAAATNDFEKNGSPVLKAKAGRAASRSFIIEAKSR